MHFWNNFYQVMLKIERLESQIIQNFGSNKTKEPKQDRQNQLRLKEENLSVINNYIQTHLQ